MVPYNSACRRVYRSGVTRHFFFNEFSIFLTINSTGPRKKKCRIISTLACRSRMYSFLIEHRLSPPSRQEDIKRREIKRSSRNAALTSSWKYYEPDSEKRTTDWTRSSLFTILRLVVFADPWTSRHGRILRQRRRRSKSKTASLRRVPLLFVRLRGKGTN